MTKVHTITTYGIQELSPKAFRKAIDENRDWNTNTHWWDGVYEDAEAIGLKITSFDLDRGANCEGLLLSSTMDVATAILATHGKETDTYKLAEEFSKFWPAKTEEQGDERDANFKDTLLALYLKALREEADYLTQEDTLCESFEANGTQFLEDGELAPYYLQ